jgi:hypothetical protein
MLRATAIALLAFAAGVGLATLFGAVNLGTAMGVGQLVFIATVCWLLLSPERD